MPQDYVLFTANDVMNGIHPLNLDMRPDDRQDYFRFYFETGLNCFRMADGNVVDLEGLLVIANRGMSLPPTPTPQYVTLFNKRHYDRIASLLYTARRDHAITPDQKELMCAIIEAFAKSLSGDNKHFDRQKFISACNS